MTGRNACDNGRIARSRSFRLAVLACGVPCILFSAEACSSSGDTSGGKSSGGAATSAAGTAATSAGGSTSGAAGLGTTAGASGGASATNASGGAGGSTTAGSGSGGDVSPAGGKQTGGTTNGSGSGGAPNAGGTGGRGGRGPGGAGRGAAGSGATGAAGASGGSSTVCGTAAENASATLTCPTGQIIDSVVFASFGTPTGTCGSFAASSSCDASSSAATVQSLCAGKSSCSVPATNSAFGGDPCHNTTKNLDIEVSCVPGEPTQPQPGNAPYKGIANSPAAQIAALGATWCYNWGDTPKSTDCNDPYFVPMIWGSGDVSKIDSIAKAGYTTVLGFNEPNKSDQANMSVADAIALWPQLTQNANIRVGSPAVSDDGRSWLEDFMKQAKQNNLRVDFIAMHWYGWNKGSCVASQLEGAVTWASQWGLPVWITEFGCMGSSNPDEQTVLDFFNAAIPMLAKHSQVERYAWYPWNTYNDVYTSGSSPMMTALGQAFAAAPQYRQ